MANKFKLMSYNDAFEASKQFIFDISKAVVRTFPPGDIKETIKIGKELSDKGVEYMHIVDIYSLSYKRYQTLNSPNNKTLKTGQGIPK